ncbi:peptidase M16 family [Patulibacter medicamentivorans]|uniref:Peptidase M16 family n=1 Tax=Patulibacter medicamentivorans TaxID=1097667 RepID=H0E1Z3_9ACTN|nr:peptidase M16 family [Patulibacter medicamentivorans]
MSTAGGPRPNGDGRGPHPPRVTRLPSGVTVATEPIGSALSVALGVWIGTGARHERDAEAGRAHLLEHMLFRGTRNYASIEIDRRFDALGGDLNAATSRDETAVVARVLADEVDDAFPILGEMVACPLLRDEDLELERKIVLEEIAMIEDDPEEYVFELLPRAVFGDHALGRPVIGTPEVVAGTSGETLRAFHAGRYRPDRIVVAAAGAVDHERLCALAERLAADVHAHDGDPQHAPNEPGVAAPSDPAVIFRTRETEQVQVAIAGRGPGMGDDRRFALRVLDTILGGTPSSRLFRAVREDRGLAYAVSTFDDQHQGGGLAGVYLGTRADNLTAALAVVADELDRVRREPVDDDELERAKHHARARLLLGLESTHARMHVLGRAVLHGLPLLRPDEIAARIDAVTAQDVQDLARELYDPAGLSAAGVGPDEQTFRSALGPIAAALTTT